MDLFRFTARLTWRGTGAGMDTYTILKVVHILSVVMFLGNIFTGLFWMYQANRTKNLDVIHHTMRTIIVSDKYFTMPGVVIITGGGIAAAIIGKLPLLGTGWIFYSLVLFTLSGIAFAWKVAPLQRRIVNFTAKENHDKFNWEEYRRLFRQWDLWGLFATATPLLALVMMVMKLPELSILAR
jgi:uncharacterized membrane protein